MSVPYESMRQKFHLTIVSIAIFSLVFSGFGSIPPAFADGTIDPLSENSVGSSLIPISAGPLGQSFTPSVDNIVAVEIKVASPCTGDWVVSIHDIVDGEIVFPSLVESGHTVDTDTSLTQHIDLAFTPLTPETLYIILISDSGDCGWLFSLEDPYPDRGTLFLGLSPLPEADFVFATLHGDPPVDEICGDGIDNDRDGLIDGDDPDCTAPPDGKKSCEALAKENPGKAIGKGKAKEKNKCS